MIRRALATLQEHTQSLLPHFTHLQRDQRAENVRTTSTSCSAELLPLGSQEFGILSANVNGNWFTQWHILDTALRRRRWHIILIQEPYCNSHDKHPKGYDLITEPVDGQPLSTCIYVREDLPLTSYKLDSTSCDCSGEDRERHDAHIASIVVTFSNGISLHITNVYNRGSLLPLRCLTSSIGADGVILVVGDFNLHHPDWESSRQAGPHERAVCEAFRTALHLLNETDQYTFSRPHGNQVRSSVLDLAWITPSEVEQAEWRLVSELLLPKEDHIPTEIVLFGLETESLPADKLLWRQVDEKKFRLSAEARIKDIDFRQLHDSVAIEDASVRLMDALKATQLEVPLGPRSQSKITPRVLTPEMVAQRTKRNQARSYYNSIKTHNNSLHRSTTDLDLQARMYQAENMARDKWCEEDVAFRKLERTENDKRWRRVFMGRLSNFHQMAKWAKRQNNRKLPRHLPTLIDEQGRELRVGREQANGLARTWYAQFQSRSVSACELCEEPVPRHAYEMLQLPSSPLYHRVQRAFNKLKEYKAPGYDSIGPPCIRRCRAILAPRLVYLVHACIQRSHFPQIFKEGRIIPLRKAPHPTKSYRMTERWRPVCLLPTMGKIIETVIADIIAELAATNDLLPKTQMAVRGRSTETALIYLVEIIRTAGKNGLIVSIFSLDIKGAYDHANRKHLLDILLERGVPKNLVDLIQSWLNTRTVKISLPGHDEPFEVSSENGLPQGSPLSLILFAFSASGLLDISCVESEEGLTFKMAFADDVYLIPVTRSLEANQILVQRGYQECEHWAHSTGNRFSKFQCLHFAPIAERKTARPMSDFIPGFEDPEKPNTEIKILGIIFHVDRRGNLKWDRQYEQVKGQAAALQASFRRVVRPTWGLQVEDARQHYLTHVRSVLTYGCAAWYTPEADAFAYYNCGPGTDVDFDYDDKLDDDPDYVPTHQHASDLYVHDAISIRLRKSFEARQNDFLRPIAGAPWRTPSILMQKEMFVESLNLFMRRVYLASRARLIDDEAGDTIRKATTAIERFARDTVPYNLRSRTGNTSIIPGASSCPSSQAEVDVQKIYHLAVERVEQKFDIIQDEERYARELNKEIRACAKKDGHRRMSEQFDAYKESREAEGYRLPACFNEGFGRRCFGFYKGLQRPLNCILFCLRTEEINLRERLFRLGVRGIDSKFCTLCTSHRERAGKQPYFETVPHLLQYCTALADKRPINWPPNAIRMEGNRPCEAPSGGGTCRDWNLLYTTHGVDAAKWAFKNFPLTQYDWARDNQVVNRYNVYGDV